MLWLMVDLVEGMAAPAVCLLCGIVSDSSWGDVRLAGGDVSQLPGNDL